MKASSVGAKTVNGPGPLRLPLNCDAFSSVSRLVNRPSAVRVSIMFFPAACVGATVVIIVVGAVVINVVVGTIVI